MCPPSFQITFLPFDCNRSKFSTLCSECTLVWCRNCNDQLERLKTCLPHVNHHLSNNPDYTTTLKLINIMHYSFFIRTRGSFNSARLSKDLSPAFPPPCVRFQSHVKLIKSESLFSDICTLPKANVRCWPGLHSSDVANFTLPLRSFRHLSEAVRTANRPHGLWQLSRGRVSTPRDLCNVCGRRGSRIRSCITALNRRRQC